MDRILKKIKKMKYLNLTKGFNPYNAQEHELIEHESFTFKGGEPHIKLIDFNLGVNVTVTCRIASFNDLGLLAVAMEALHQSGYLNEVYLFTPYFPGARQDRRMVEGEPLTVKVYADIINEMDFDCVTILDPHSHVAPSLIENCEVINNHRLVVEAIGDMVREKTEVDGQSYNIIAPDAGASKKAEELVAHLQGLSWTEDSGEAHTLFDDKDRLIYCQKKRNVSTGELSGFHADVEDLRNTPCIIVDDICDGGGTFLGLAEELKKKHAGNLYLVVTHGIFSKGLHKLCKAFKTVYTTNSVDPLKYFVGVVPKNFKQLNLTKDFILES